MKALLYEFATFLLNALVARIPCWVLRRAVYKVVGMSVGTGSEICMRQYFISPTKFRIGCFSHVNQGCLFDCREGIEIGNSVSISHKVSIFTGSHDVQDRTFKYKGGRVVVKDYAWIGANAIILDSVTIGEGAVVGAGAVVTKNIAPYTIVGGIPARKIGDRAKCEPYRCQWPYHFM